MFCENWKGTTQNINNLNLKKKVKENKKDSININYTREIALIVYEKLLLLLIIESTVREQPQIKII